MSALSSRPENLAKKERLAISNVANQNCQRGNVLRRNSSAVYPGLVEKTYQRTY